jgi:hypothetical protein
LNSQRSALQVKARDYFCGFYFFAWLWGVVGALLAVSLLVSLKVICERVPVLLPFVKLQFANKNKKQLRILHIFSAFNNLEVLKLRDSIENLCWHEFCKVDSVQSINTIGKGIICYNGHSFF